MISCSFLKQNKGTPNWVYDVPKKSGEICAVGSSEPTFFRVDARIAAEDSVRAELARSINVRIESVMVDFQGEKNSQVRKSEMSSVTSYTTETVLKGAKILEYWFDSDGSGPDKRKGMMYALGCMKSKNN